MVRRIWRTHRHRLFHFDCSLHGVTHPLWKPSGWQFGGWGIPPGLTHRLCLRQLLQMQFSGIKKIITKLVTMGLSVAETEPKRASTHPTTANFMRFAKLKIITWKKVKNIKAQKCNLKRLIESKHVFCVARQLKNWNFECKLQRRLPRFYLSSGLKSELEHFLDLHKISAFREE